MGKSEREKRLRTAFHELRGEIIRLAEISDGILLALRSVGDVPRFATPQQEPEGVVEVPEPWPLKGSTRVDVAAGLLEEKVREKLMALGWTPPPEAQEEPDGDGGQDLRTEVYLSVSELLGRGLKGHEAMIAEEAMKATLRARSSAGGDEGVSETRKEKSPGPEAPRPGGSDGE